MKGYMLRAIWEFAQSADCVAQTEYPQNACNLQIGKQSADCCIAQTEDPQNACNLQIGKQSADCANC